ASVDEANPRSASLSSLSSSPREADATAQPSRLGANATSLTPSPSDPTAFHAAATGLIPTPALAPPTLVKPRKGFSSGTPSARLSSNREPDRSTAPTSGQKRTRADLGRTGKQLRANVLQGSTSAFSIDDDDDVDGGGALHLPAGRGDGP